MKSALFKLIKSKLILNTFIQWMTAWGVLCEEWGVFPAVLCFSTGSAESFGRRAEVAFVRLKLQWAGFSLALSANSLVQSPQCHRCVSAGLQNPSDTLFPSPQGNLRQNPSSIWHKGGMQCSTPSYLFRISQNACIWNRPVIPSGYSKNRQEEAGTSCVFHHWWLVNLQVSLCAIAAQR